MLAVLFVLTILLVQKVLNQKLIKELKKLFNLKLIVMKVLIFEIIMVLKDLISIKVFYYKVNLML
jgi:hypothetical protein